MKGGQCKENVPLHSREDFKEAFSTLQETSREDSQQSAVERTAHSRAINVLSSGSMGGGGGGGGGVIAETGLKPRSGG